MCSYDSSGKQHRQNQKPSLIVSETYCLLIHRDSDKGDLLISPKGILSCDAHVVLSFKSNYERSYLLEYCTIENKMLSPKISHCLESQILQPDFHYICSFYLDHSLKYHWTSFMYLGFRSGANNLPKDRFLGRRVSSTCSQISRLGSYLQALPLNILSPKATSELQNKMGSSVCSCFYCVIINKS